MIVFQYHGLALWFHTQCFSFLQETHTLDCSFRRFNAQLPSLTSARIFHFSFKLPPLISILSRPLPSLFFGKQFSRSF